MSLPQFKTVYNQSGEALLPHRPPFLFVDRLLSADETGGIGEYTFTREKNEFFKGRAKKPLGIFKFKGYLNGEADAKGLPAVECTVKCMMGDGGHAA